MNSSQHKLDEIIDTAVSKKNTIIQELNLLISKTDDNQDISKIGFTLVDNFKDETIEDVLIGLIKNPFWKKRNGTFLFLLSEYTNDSKYLYFLLDLVLKNYDDGEILMGGYSMILNLHPPFEKIDITKCLRRLRMEYKKKDLNKEKSQLIISLINFLEGQRNIAKFYNKFGK